MTAPRSPILRALFATAVVVGVCAWALVRAALHLADLATGRR